MSTVGEYLKNTRLEKKLSLNAVKDKTGISDSALSHIESGKTESPSPEYLKKLASFYQIDVIDLFIKAGYLEYTDLTGYQRCFYGADVLSQEEHKAIQSIIDVIAKKAEGCPQ
jgi:transcriptional regulator with XRE-family HTH domain